MTLHIYDVEQRSDEWHAARRGIVTASTVGRLITTATRSALDYECTDCGAFPANPCVSKRQPFTPMKTLHEARHAAAAADDTPPKFVPASDDTARGLTRLLAAERITCYTEPTYQSDDMFRGVIEEPRARDHYSAHYAEAVEAGFMVRSEQGWRLGYSPDGLVGDDGLLEVKAPRQKEHLRTILADEVPPQYMPQLQAGLLVSGREWIDYLSWCGGMPAYVKRVHPDPRWQEAITAAVEEFEETVSVMVAVYRNATEGLAPTERIEYGEVELKLA